MHEAIRIAPLTASHVANLGLLGFPTDFWAAKAIAAIAEDGEVLGIAGASVDGDVAVVGMILSPRMRQRGVILNRLVLRGMAGLLKMGIRRIHAQADTTEGVRWLRRLGFVEKGAFFEKYLP